MTSSETVGVSTLVGIPIPNLLSETDGESVAEILESRMTKSLKVGTSVGEISDIVKTSSEIVGVSTLVGIPIPDLLSETDGESVAEIFVFMITLSEIVGVSKAALIIVPDALSEIVGVSATEIGT